MLPESDTYIKFLVSSKINRRSSHKTIDSGRTEIRFGHLKEFLKTPPVLLLLASSVRKCA